MRKTIWPKLGAAGFALFLTTTTVNAQDTVRVRGTIDRSRRHHCFKRAGDLVNTQNSDDRPIESLTPNLSSRSVELHDLAGPFALTIEVGFIDDVQFAAPLIPGRMIELEFQN